MRTTIVSALAGVFALGLATAEPLPGSVELRSPHVHKGPHEAGPCNAAAG